MQEGIERGLNYKKRDQAIHLVSHYFNFLLLINAKLTENIMYIHMRSMFNNFTVNNT
ncbi:protein of unknown function [Bacillus velezensis UCMB5113]|nr:protein of unknown function [Bacillus velezensis UCMB5113]